MTPVTYEERLAALEEMGIEEKALIYDEATDKLAVSKEETAIIKTFTPEHSKNGR